MPVWLQISLPVFTAILGSALTLAVQRINKSLDRKQDKKDAEAALLAQRPAFSIQRGEKLSYYLINSGDADATGVTLDTNNFPDGLLRGKPDGIDIPSGSQHKFLILRLDQAPSVANFFVICDQFSEPQSVPVPDL